MSEPSRLRAYRACVNLPEASNGKVILIDDTDARWADRISSGMLTPVGPPPDYVEPDVPWTRDNAIFASSNEDEKSAPPDGDELAAAGLDPVVPE